MLFLKLYKDLRYANELASLSDIRHITCTLVMEILKKKKQISGFLGKFRNQC